MVFRTGVCILVNTETLEHLCLNTHFWTCPTQYLPETTCAVTTNNTAGYFNQQVRGLHGAFSPGRAARWLSPRLDV